MSSGRFPGAGDRNSPPLLNPAGILAVGFEKYGSEEELEKDAITHLYDVYVKINRDGETDESIHDRAREFFVKMEAGDEQAVGLWKKFRDLSIVKYKETYARLNIYFDLYSGESQVSSESQTQALDQLQQAGLVEESQGALVIDLKKYKLEKTVVRKKDGTSVYITRDIGGAVERYEKYHFDKMMYVVASQQDLHLAQFFKVLDLMGYPWAKTLQHVNFGMVQGMSTRKGTAVFLEQILDESKRVMHEVMQKNEAKYNAIEDPDYTSDKLGITAVKVQDMAGKRCVPVPLFTVAARLTAPPPQNQQLRVQVGAHDFVRGRHGWAPRKSALWLVFRADTLHPRPPQAPTCSTRTCGCRRSSARTRPKSSCRRRPNAPPRSTSRS